MPSEPCLFWSGVWLNWCFLEKSWCFFLENNSLTRLEPKQEKSILVEGRENAILVSSEEGSKMRLGPKRGSMFFPFLFLVSFFLVSGWKCLEVVGRKWRLFFLGETWLADTPMKKACPRIFVGLWFTCSELYQSHLFRSSNCCQVWHLFLLVSSSVFLATKSHLLNEGPGLTVLSFGFASISLSLTSARTGNPNNHLTPSFPSSQGDWYS